MIIVATFYRQLPSGVTSLLRKSSAQLSAKRAAEPTKPAVSVVRMFCLAMICTMACVMTGCGEPAPVTPGAPVPAVTSQNTGPFQSQAKAIHRHLVANLAGKPLVGYGGRRFSIRFEPQVQVQVQKLEAAGDPQKQSTDEPAVRVHFVHWQVQKKESMKYELELSFESIDGKWQLTEGTNRYLGLKDSAGFKPSEGFKKLKVLKRIKGNVYDRPIHQAVDQTLGQ
jgi:hypothetical protein